MTNTSLWTSLRNPTFRRLWIASVVSGICVSSHDTAATWMMNTLTPSRFLISLIATVALSRFGANWIFAANAVCFLLVIAAVAQWKRKEKQTKLPLENFFESLAGAIRYVRYAPGIQIVLARNALFSLFISVIPAL